MNCEGKVAVVTGAAGGGLGRSIALTLAREGARVVVNYRTSRESAEAIVGRIQGSGGNAVAVAADVFEADGCKKLVEATVERFGRVDICIVGPGGGALHFGMRAALPVSWMRLLGGSDITGFFTSLDGGQRRPPPFAHAWVPRRPAGCGLELPV